MSKTLDFESDPFLTLLTDALRAGPGSPEWTEAVIRLRSERGEAQQDEYKLLVAAREDLARGRKYREVRAGPGFTRRLFGVIETERSGTHRSWPLASLIAVLSLCVVVGLLAFAAYTFWPQIRNQQVSRSDEPESLSRLFFTEPVASTRFREASGAWKAFGLLPLKFSQGGLTLETSPDPDSYVGGGLMFTRGFAPDEPAAVEFQLKAPAKGRDAILQVFLTDTPAFDEKTAATPHELVWLLRDGTMSVISPEGHLLKEAPLPSDAADGASLKVRLVSDGRNAIVSAGDVELYNGTHGLEPTKQRFIGVRILSRGELGDNAPLVKSVEIHKPFVSAEN